MSTATSNKNRRLLVDSDDLFKYVLLNHRRSRSPQRWLGLVAPLQFTFVKIGFAQISPVPESSHFQESRTHLQSSTAAAAATMAHTFRASTKVTGSQSTHWYLVYFQRWSQCPIHFHHISHGLSCCRVIVVLQRTATKPIQEIFTS